MSESKDNAEQEVDIVLYSVEEGVAWITMNRPQYNNAQNGRMTYELDDAFKRAVADDEVKVIVLRGEGKHFSAGHDIGTPGRDVHLSQDRVSMWYDHANKEGGEFLYVREAEAYLGMCRRWRDIPKPTIAAVQGACIAGGLMLAWVCDLIVATDDAYFSDPVVRMGIPGVEYFAHPYELNPRIAKEFLFTGNKMGVERAYQMGMVNQISSRENLHQDVKQLAEKIADMPRLGLALTKQAINNVEDLQGKRAGMEAAFAWHHFSHVHNDLVSGDKLGGFDAKKMAEANKKQDKS
ncbi:MAG: enoyl-CoA hydratase [Proteobacteria bacterium]|jgi:enoyl-CoA hydratase|nr:enoyl-CoA hydratase [Pseudomonadota bacterium]